MGTPETNLTTPPAIYEFRLISGGNVRQHKLEKFGANYHFDTFARMNEPPGELHCQILENGQVLIECVPTPCTFKSDFRGFQFDGETDDFSLRIRITNTKPKNYGIICELKPKSLEMKRIPGWRD